MKVNKMIAVLALVLAASSQAANLTVTEKGDCKRTGVSASGLSGITYVGGDKYYAVNDSDGLLHELTIGINRSTGEITSCTVGAGVTCSGGVDLEGCAFDPGSGYVWASDETGSKIKEFNPESGAVLRTAPVPAIFKTSNCYDNYSFEALTIRGDGLEMWTCNEEALKSDGTNSTSTDGCVVRLLRFTRPTVDAAWEAAGQYAYLTQKIGSYSSFFDGKARSGVSGLCCLPDGTLIVLERRLTGGLLDADNFYNGIYKVDYSNATDVSDIDSLKTATYTKVTKSLLLQIGTGMEMYEGICLGPRLDNGSLVLVLVSDSDSSGSGKVKSLVLSGLDVRTVTIEDPCKNAVQHGTNFRFPAGQLRLENNLPEVIDGKYPSVGWSLASAPALVHDGGVCAFNLTADETVVWHYTFTGVEADVAAKWNVAPIRDGAWVETFENGYRYWMTNSAPDNAIVTWESVAAAKGGALVDHTTTRANNWFGDSAAQALRISADLDEETRLHTGSLAGGVESVAASAADPVYIEMKGRITRQTSSFLSEPVDAKLSIFISEENKLVCWSALGFATNQTQTVDPDGINRITLKIARDRFQVRWNDEVLSFVGPDGVTRDELPTADGKTLGEVSEVAVAGNAVIDDVYISHGDPANPISGAETATKLAVSDAAALSDSTLTRVNRWLSENDGRFVRSGTIASEALQTAYLLDKPEWLDGEARSVEFKIADVTVNAEAKEATVTAAIVCDDKPISATVNGRLVFTGAQELTDDFDELTATSLPRAAFDAAGKVTRTFSFPDGFRFFKAVIAPFESWARD